MIYFPTPYEDELLYSVIARYHVRTGNVSPKATIEELFGYRTVTAVMDLPSYINTLSSRLPDFIKLSTDELIYKYTMYPYYAAFLSKNRANELLEKMKSNYGGDIHSSTGIMASGIHNMEYFRYCPECNKEDLEKHGELYWHRLYQVPGVLVCPGHGMLLQNSQVKIHCNNKHEYIPATDYSCTPKIHAIKLTNNELNKCIVIAKDINWIFENYSSEKSSDGIREKYLSILAEKGFATVNGIVHQAEFLQSFTDFYGDNMLKLFDSKIEFSNQDNWLSSIVRKHRKAFHPIRHLLLMSFLGTTPDEIFNSTYSYKPFGNGPWPCLNAAAAHYRKNVIKKVNIKYSVDLKAPVGTFTCSCGFSYSRSGPDKSDQDRYKIGKVNCYGAVWEDKLKQIIDAGNCSLREIARKFNIDPKTIKKYSVKLGISKFQKDIGSVNINQKNTEARDLCDSDRLRLVQRTKWLELINSNEGLSKTELRNLDKGLYTWLYRHDRDWLNTYSPPAKLVKVENTRVDWFQRDKELLEKVKQTVKEMLQSDTKPEMINICKIGKRIGALSILEKHLYKLPETKTYLNMHVETIEAFHIRRIRWAVKILNASGEELKPWKIIRKAGIRDEYVENLKEEIYKEIEKYSVTIDMKNDMM